MTFFSPDSTSTHNLTKQIYDWLPVEQDSYLKTAGKEILTRTVCLVAMPIFCVISATFQTAVFILKTPFVIITLPFALFLNVPKNLQFSEWLLHVSQVYLLFMRVVITPIAFFSPRVCCSVYALIELSHRQGLKVLFEQEEIEKETKTTKPSPTPKTTSTNTNETLEVVSRELSLETTINSEQPGAPLTPQNTTLAPSTPPGNTRRPSLSPASLKAKADAAKAKEEAIKAENENFKNLELLKTIQQKKDSGIALEPHEIIADYCASFLVAKDKQAYIERRQTRETKFSAAFCCGALTIPEFMQWKTKGTIDPLKKLALEMHVLAEEVDAIALEKEEALLILAHKSKLEQEHAHKLNEEEERYKKIENQPSETFSDSEAILFYIHRLTPILRSQHDSDSEKRHKTIKQRIEAEVRDLEKRANAEFIEAEVQLIKKENLPHFMTADKANFRVISQSLTDVDYLKAYKTKLTEYVKKSVLYNEESEARYQVIKAKYPILSAEEIKECTIKEFIAIEAKIARKEIEREKKLNNIDSLLDAKREEQAAQSKAIADTLLKTEMAARKNAYASEDFDYESEEEFD